MKVLIAGICGAVARRVAVRLSEAGHEVAGIDTRPWPDKPEAIALFDLDIRKRAAEDVFRRERPEAVLHMATVSAWASRGEGRNRMNLGATRAVFDHCKAFGVRQVVFVGRHTFYGAAADSPLYHKEDEAPLALESFPELADLIAADLYAAAALWQMPEATTAVLRVVYTLGPSGQGTLASFLKGPVVPMVAGFDPLMQFMHEEDAAAAIALAVEKKLRGVYNVAGPQPVPLSIIARALGRPRLPLPEFIARLALGRAGLPDLPAGALGHVKFPVVVDAGAFQQATGFAPAHDETETLRLFESAFPRPAN